jgi:hypothetical protein
MIQIYQYENIMDPKSFMIGLVEISYSRLLKLPSVITIFHNILVVCM